MQHVTEMLAPYEGTYHESVLPAKDALVALGRLPPLTVEVQDLSSC